MFSRNGISKPSGSVYSSKMCKNVSTSRGAENKYVVGSGVGASSISARRAKNVRASHPPVVRIVMPTLPLAPVITAIASKTTTSVIINFTQTANAATITNYKYSVDGGLTYTALSPARIVSPLTISGLASGTSYDLSIKAVSAAGDSASSNQIAETTYAEVFFDSFTDVGADTWTAPVGVTEIEYLIVGGGGGGGSTYSDIEVIGSVDLASSSPGAGVYWINSTAGSNYGYLYKGGSKYTSSKPVRLTAPQIITPNGKSFEYNKWHNFEMVYSSVSNGGPNASNFIYVQPQGVPTSTYSNNISAGSGGGGGGHVRTSSIYPLTKHAVVPGTTYNLYVGAGGAGGTGAASSETSGTSGEASYFDTLTASGAAGGSGSRSGFSQNGGGGFSDTNIMGGRGGAGGGRNGGAVINSELHQWFTTVLRGTYGGSGITINFNGLGNVAYGGGGDGGDANTESTQVVPSNVGKGGEGTGATLNSYYSGRDGGSGIVIIKYYT
jgi:hypothetical protein